MAGVRFRYDGHLFEDALLCHAAREAGFSLWLNRDVASGTSSVEMKRGRVSQ